jgi:hypothetical protein
MERRGPISLAGINRRRETDNEPKVVKMAVLEDAVAKELVDFIRQEVAAEVEKQTKEIRYRGAWQPGEKYWKHNSVSYDGSTWTCLRDTEGKPGQCLDWQLSVKKGRDGKDARAAA